MSSISAHRPEAIVARLTARAATRPAALWGALFGVLIFNEAVSYYAGSPTVAERQEIVRTFSGNVAFAALLGPARRLDTVGGFVSWRMLGLMVWIGAVWGLLLATRLLRREEEIGRWDLLLVGPTTRSRATAHALGGLAAGWLVLWTITAAFTLVAGTRPHVGFSTVGALLYATAATASAAMFLAVGALVSQLAATRRQANGFGALILAAAFLIRLIADTIDGAAALRWASPLGWIEELRPFTGAQPVALVPMALLIAGASAGAIVLAGRRDVGAAILTRRRARPPRTRLLESAGLLVVRLERWVALAWVVGLAGIGAIFGITASVAAGGGIASVEVGRTVERLGATPSDATTAWIGYEFLYIAALLAYAAAVQIATLRREEADGHLDHLLVRPLSRRAWLGGQLRFGAAFVVAAALATGIAAWAGLAAGSGGVPLSAMVKAGLNLIPPALFVLGVGALVFGLAPRLAAPCVYALVLWSFLIEIVGTSITSSRWILDTALFTHVGPVPAADLNWTAMGVMTGIAVLAAVAGAAAFRRRDLAPA